MRRVCWQRFQGICAIAVADKLGINMSGTLDSPLHQRVGAVDDERCRRGTAGDVLIRFGYSAPAPSDLHTRKRAVNVRVRRGNWRGEWLDDLKLPERTKVDSLHRSL